MCISRPTRCNGFNRNDDQINRFSLVDISIIKTCYSSTRLNILESLCSDVILGFVFQSQHQNLVIKFYEESTDLVVPPQSHCILTAAKTPEVSLFSNLSKNVKPIATRLRHYNPKDRAFIQENVDKFLKEGIILPSSSLWKAQVLIAKDEFSRHEKRMCIDYFRQLIYSCGQKYRTPSIFSIFLHF